MTTCLISLGSNLGDRAGNLRAAIQRLDEHPKVTLLESSSFHSTRPAGGPAGQREFLNAAARVETALSPQALLDLLLELETRLGRDRGRRWDARVIDLDLLLYGTEVLDTPALQLPHPRMSFRRFALAPAVEVAPEMIHPTTNWTVRQLLEHLDTAIDYVAITGLPETGKTHLVSEVSRSMDLTWLPDAADALTMKPYLLGAHDDAVAAELGLAAKRSKQLSRLNQHSGAFVSDFWFDQSLAFARTWLSGDKLAGFESRFSEIQNDAVPPKLLVFLDVACSRSPGERSEIPANELQQLDAHQRHLINRSRRGPVLTLRDRATAVAEVTAAVQAMQ